MESTPVPLTDEPAKTAQLGRRGYVTYRQDGSLLSFAPPLEAVCPQCGGKHDGNSLCSTCARYAGEP